MNRSNRPRVEARNTPKPTRLKTCGPLLAIGGALLGCAPASQEALAGAASPPSSATPSSHTQPAPAPTQADEPIPEELSLVVRVRGLNAKDQVAMRIISRSDLRAHFEASLDAHLPAHAALGTEEMLFALGVVPRTFRYREATLQLLEAEIAGFYDPLENAMFLLGDLSAEVRGATLTHELVHALQDQHYNLDRLTTFAEDQTDAMSALSSLAEGDATSVMFDALLLPEHKTALDLPIEIVERQLKLASEQSRTAGVPPVLTRSLLAPYVDGVRFVHALRETGGFGAVDAAWKAPPTTTEQLLHIERYRAREAAVQVDVPPPPKDGGAPWKPVLHDRWGEQSWRVVFEEFTSAQGATTAARGWGGDRIVHYQRGTEHAVAAVLVMDTEEDAREVESIFISTKAKAKPSPARALNSAAAPQCFELPNGSRLALRRTGATLVFAAGAHTRSAPEANDCAESIEYSLAVSSQL
jgi:hypothetical protein